MLTLENTVFALVDVQGRLAQLMHEKERLFDSLQRLVRGMQALKVPIIWMEQIPDKMGPTIAELSLLLPDQQPIAKTSFSCWGEPAFRQALGATGKQQVLIAGIEAHVCVYQTAVDLVAESYHVEVVEDAVSSRTKENRRMGLHRCEQGGARLTTVEMALFEMMRTAEHSAFKEALAIVK